MYPLYNADASLKPCEFMGFGMLQNRMGVPAWSYALEVLRPKTVIELGTYDGAFSVPLAIACKNFGAHFVTIDRNPYNEKWKWWFDILKIDFRLRPDMLSADCVQEIKGLISSEGISFVLCDGGNKPREFNVFSEFIKNGDVIGAHDYMEPGSPWWRSCEIVASDVVDSCSKWNLEPWNHELFMTAAWLVKRKR